MPKTLCVDFDGVIHSYSSGWKGLTEIPDPPVPGAFEFLTRAVEADFVVCIYSSRSKGNSHIKVNEPFTPVQSASIKLDMTGVKAMRAWFVEHGLAADVLSRLKFPLVKPAAMMTIDDRAVCFNGVFPTLEWIDSFKPWNKIDGGAPSLANARGYFGHVALDSDRGAVLRELEQLLVDLMDVLNQTEEEAPVIAAYEALRGARRP